MKKFYPCLNELKPDLPPMNGSDSNSFPLEARKNEGTILENITPSFSEPEVRASREKITSNMTAFISGKSGLEEILPKILLSEELHAKWLNTLSYLENCGARKIAACEHPTFVKEEMLKHASEEFRHAHYLKKQINKNFPFSFDDYSISYLLGGKNSINYLNILDIRTCIYLSKIEKLPKSCMRKIAYLLVTYAIELRADELYKIYDEFLRAARSKIFVKSILLEEKEHLVEMERGINSIESGNVYAEKVVEIEGELCKKWLSCIALQI